MIRTMMMMMTSGWLRYLSDNRIFDDEDDDSVKKQGFFSAFMCVDDVSCTQCRRPQPLRRAHFKKEKRFSLLLRARAGIDVISERNRQNGICVHLIRDDDEADLSEV